MMIHDTEGNEVGEIELSEKQRRVLEAGEDIVVIYNTPQTMRHVLGSGSGSFTLSKMGDRTIVRETDALRQYAQLQRGIKAARGRT